MRAHSACRATDLLVATLVVAATLATMARADPIGSNQSGTNLGIANQGGRLVPSENYEENKRLIQDIFQKHPMIYQELLRSIPMPNINSNNFPLQNPFQGNQPALSNLSPFGFGQYPMQLQGHHGGYGGQYPTSAPNYHAHAGGWMQSSNGFPLNQQQPHNNWNVIPGQFPNPLGMQQGASFPAQGQYQSQ